MTHLRGIFSELRKWFGPPPSSGPEVRMKLINVTRQTQLASSVEVAESGAKRSRGLLGRTGLGTGEALWIVPCEAVHTIGMRFALDLIYLDRKYRIRKIRTNVPPWRLSACLSAHSVVELAAGSVHPKDAQLGDLVQFLPTQE